MDEINQQNVTYEEEEKKIKIVLGVVAALVLPTLLSNLSFIMHLIGVLLLFSIMILGVIAGGIYVGCNIRFILNQSNNLYEEGKTRIVYAFMLIAFALVLILSDRWDGFIKVLIALFSSANVILFVRSKLKENASRKLLTSITVQTILMVILAVLL